MGMTKAIKLYGPNGDIVTPRPKGLAAYDGASTSRRLSAWTATSLGPNSVLFNNLDKLRNRSRDAVRKMPYAASALESYTASAIGTGVKPRFMHRTPAVRKKLQQLWARHVKQADFDGLTNFYGLQAMAWHSMMESGEVLARFQPSTDPKLLVPLQVELLESDHLATYQFGRGAGTGNVPDGNVIRYGIEFNTRGQRVAYHLYKNHPNEDFAWANGGYELVRVPVDEVMHVYVPLRPKQMRGEPWLTRILVRLYQLDRYDDAELERKINASSLTGFIETTIAEEEGIFGSDGEGVSADGNSTNAEVEPGTWTELSPGEKATPLKTDDIPTAYNQFHGTQRRTIAAGIGVVPQHMDGDYSNANLASTRIAVMEFKRRCELILYSFFNVQFNQRYMSEFLAMAALSQQISPQDFFNNRDEYEDVRWVGPGWPVVDPLKETIANTERLKWRLTSRASLLAEEGEDIEQIDSENDDDSMMDDVPMGGSESGIVNQPKSGASTAPGGSLGAGPNTSNAKAQPSRPGYTMNRKALIQMALDLQDSEEDVMPPPDPEGRSESVVQ